MREVVLVYTSTYELSDGERECVRRLENAGRKVALRNGQFFDTTEPAVAVYSNVDRILKAFERLGVETHRIGGPTGKMLTEPTPLEEDEPERIVTHEVRGAWAYVYVDGEKVDTVRKSQIREALARWEHT